ncbi:cytochrome P450 81Q32-like [Impatiens glandulifera]|uniref:cytochrome P450 81Q32-like n=1 Tax=Impatiens glandulifera TaxID=253017 RepID=UPI001FB132ED|nr:cytochrome P450 81Q32-like [Impatiens glandulifera]
MELIYYIISLASAFSFFIFMLLNKKVQSKNLPPSPLWLPILGHLYLLKHPLHRTLHHLSQTYGPVYFLWFGSRPALVVSNPSMAEECFTKNDIIFANRPHVIVGKYLSYDYTTVGSSNYGDLWKNLRRVATVELLSPTRLNMFFDIRQEEVKNLVKNLFSESKLGFTRVEMKSRCSELPFNIIMRMVTGKRYFGNEVEERIEEEAKRFRELIREMLEASVSSNPGDFLPIFGWFDFQNIEKRMSTLMSKVDTFMEELIEERRHKCHNLDQDVGNMSKTMVDAMLSLQDSDPQYYSDKIIKGMILTMLTGGSDTSSTTIEWAMSLLLNNQEVLKKATSEIDICISQGRLVEESDLHNLPYIQAIVNETLRLFPAGPLLIPHENSEACTVGGYDVPRGTMLFVNAWSIQRDPRVWDEPTCFKPERFCDGGGEGELGYKFLPFGMGRRRCPGVVLANKVVGLALATLIQCFEWERVSVELVDMSEGTGITMPKAIPLEAMCKAREGMMHVLTQI